MLYHRVATFADTWRPKRLADPACMMGGLFLVLCWPAALVPKRCMKAAWTVSPSGSTVRSMFDEQEVCA